MRFVKTIPAFSNNQQNNGIFAKQFCLTNTWQKNFYKLKSSAFFPCPHKAGGGQDMVEERMTNDQAGPEGGLYVD